MTLWWWPGVTKLLLCGLSGAGKTTAGEQLRALGWTHFDCEENNLESYGQNPFQVMPEDRNVVASWGLLPKHLDTVEALTFAGYLPVWLWGASHRLDNCLRERGMSVKHVREWRASSVCSAQAKALTVVSPVMVLNVFRPDGSRWDVTALLHDVFWEA
jgi:hypothetical protein